MKKKGTVFTRLTRRQALEALGGAAAVAWTAACSNSSAAPTSPSSSSGGSTSSSCAVPLSSAAVEIWQCDASGNYSEYSQPGYNGTGQTFLPGLQMTDANGQVT